MNGGLLRATAKGGAAGAVGSLVQAAAGKAEDLLFLPPREDSHIAPRLMDRIARMTRRELSDTERWASGTIFHFGYGAAWGKLYALVRECYAVHPLTGGAALGAFIYTITFPRWGGAVLTRTERPPEARSGQMEILALTVTLAFGLATAYTYESLRDRNA